MDDDGHQKWYKRYQKRRARSPSITENNLLPSRHSFADEDLDIAVNDNVNSNARLKFYGQNCEEIPVHVVDTISGKCQPGNLPRESILMVNGHSDHFFDVRMTEASCAMENNSTISQLREKMASSDADAPDQERRLKHAPNNCCVTLEREQRAQQSLLPHCHSQLPKEALSKTAKNQLLLASILCLIFMIAEAVGGYLSSSLAIMTDAVHLTSDFTSFMISLFALYMASKPSTKRMSFGYHRAEILGAAISVLLILILTGVLTYMAILRIIYQDYDIDADTMLIVASIGIGVNIVMVIVFHGMCTGHGHSHHATGHSHHATGHSHTNGEQNNINSDGNIDTTSKNINVHAAFIHVIGDFVQSIGVFTAALIIKFKPTYKLADPICTFIFAILVLLTTFHIMQDIVLVLMEGFPKTVDFKVLKKNMEKIDGVKMVHNLHVWSLTMDRIAISVHLAVDSGLNFQSILKRAEAILHKKHKFNHVTIQVENYVPMAMDACQDCKEPNE